MSLDREEQSEYVLEITLNDQGFPPMTASVAITVLVTDENDNAPRFDQLEYHVTLVDQSPAGTVILIPHALDPDQEENSQITFSLEGLDAAPDLFTIDRNSGIIQLGQTMSLSILLMDDTVQENNPVVTLTIQAEDGGSPSLQGTALLHVQVLDVTDDTPYFTEASYRGTLRENSPAGQSFCYVILQYLSEIYVI